MYFAFGKDENEIEEMSEMNLIKCFVGSNKFDSDYFYFSGNFPLKI
jgi:hypothetical protein